MAKVAYCRFRNLTSTMPKYWNWIIWLPFFFIPLTVPPSTHISVVTIFFTLMQLRNLPCSCWMHNNFFRRHGSRPFADREGPREEYDGQRNRDDHHSFGRGRGGYNPLFYRHNFSHGRVNHDSLPYRHTVTRDFRTEHSSDYDRQHKSELDISDMSDKRTKSTTEGRSLAQREKQKVNANLLLHQSVYFICYSLSYLNSPFF